ncbi:MAG: molybdopterin-guanine dinucleotide biosynthesis protein B [Gallionellaceae bacterium]|nr:molybdopterin-guanine dinucleotide biosynthesis protein B [Gallionellaceae bacterium]
MKVLGFAGYSGSGKTTLIERLLPLFRADGLRVAVIKQSHHDVEVDQPGKDSWRHRQAGASEVLLTSPQRWMLVHELDAAPEPGLAELLPRLSPCDLVLVEGFRHGDHTKLEVHRRELGKPWLHPDDPRIIAVLGDAPAASITHFALDDIPAIYEFILQQLELK